MSKGGKVILLGYQPANSVRVITKSISETDAIHPNADDESTKAKLVLVREPPLLDLRNGNVSVLADMFNGCDFSFDLLVGGGFAEDGESYSPCLACLVEAYFGNCIIRSLRLYGTFPLGSARHVALKLFGMEAGHPRTQFGAPSLTQLVTPPQLLLPLFCVAEFALVHIDVGIDVSWWQSVGTDCWKEDADGCKANEAERGSCAYH